MRFCASIQISHSYAKIEENIYKTWFSTDSHCFCSVIHTSKISQHLPRLAAQFFFSPFSSFLLSLCRFLLLFLLKFVLACRKWKQRPRSYTHEHTLTMHSEYRSAMKNTHWMRKRSQTSTTTHHTRHRVYFGALMFSSDLHNVLMLKVWSLFVCMCLETHRNYPGKGRKTSNSGIESM